MMFLIRHGLGLASVAVAAPLVLAACTVETPPAGADSASTEDGDGLTAEVAEAVTSVHLAVTHQAQFATGCAAPNNLCCGLAVGNMATAYLHGVAPTAAFLKSDYQSLGLNSCCGTGTNLNQVTQVAKNVGAAPGTNGAWCTTFANIKTQLQAHHPVAVGVTYNLIGSARRCGTFSFPHVLLITGYDEAAGMWYGEDPFCSSGGQSWQSAELKAAAGAQSKWSGCSAGYEAVADYFSL